MPAIQGDRRDCPICHRTTGTVAPLALSDAWHFLDTLGLHQLARELEAIVVFRLHRDTAGAPCSGSRKRIPEEPAHAHR